MPGTAAVVERQRVILFGRTGGEMFRWEFAVAVAGQVLGVNPFDEPNVQESKDNTMRVLAEFASSGTLDVRRIDGGVPTSLVPGGEPDRDIVRPLQSLLARIREGDYFAITAYLQQTMASEETFADVRAVVCDMLGCATTLGYGPRFLHSTGQAFKGGPDSGVFLQLTCAAAHDVPVPGRKLTFGAVVSAQAAGDRSVLRDRERRILHLHLEGDLSAELSRLEGAVTDALAGS